MDEPKEGATTMKKKAQEKLAAKANPAPVADVVVEASEPAPTEDVATEAVVETAAEAVVETPAEAIAEETPATEEAAE
jgi:small subunit ribosomal protein S16